MTNFVFSRRTIQQAVNRLSAVLTREQLEKIVDRLNLEGKPRLPDMWEVMLLDAASRTGELRHEVQLATRFRPDIELSIPTGSGEPLLMVGDIETLSDAGLEQQNPVDAFSSTLWAAAAKVGINPDRLHFEISAQSDGKYGNSKTRLLLPSKGDMHKVIKEKVLPWLRQIKQKPLAHHEMKHSSHDGNIEFQLRYDPRQRFASGSHLSYKVAYSLERNPLYNALKGKKDQLRGAHPHALRLVFACDGDCALLSDFNNRTTNGAFSAEQIAEHFLKKNSTVDAVLLIGYKESANRLDARLVFAPPSARSPRLTPASIDLLVRTLKNVITNLPQPLRSPANANIRLSKPGTGPDMMGAIHVDGQERYRISSRAVQRLLAGEITVEEFQRSHGWLDPRPQLTNPFISALAGGSMIASVEVAHGETLDDDWLIFSFGNPDPALGPFTVP